MAKRPVFIDTSAWILALRKSGPDEAQKKVKNLLDKDLVATCGMIILELLGGAKDKQDYEELLIDLQALDYLKVETKTWLASAKLSFDLRRKGIKVPSTDVLIATLALSYDCQILHDDKHFDMIAGQTQLKAERIVKPELRTRL